MRSKHLISCSSDKVTSTLIGESFEENSRCYETDAGIPICLETTCNPIEKTLSFLVQGRIFHCSYHGQVINVGSGYSVVCPRIAAVCPDLVCPSNCSGKGTCDYCKEVQNVFVIIHLIRLTVASKVRDLMLMFMLINLKLIVNDSCRNDLIPLHLKYTFVCCPVWLVFL